MSLNMNTNLLANLKGNIKITGKTLIGISNFQSFVLQRSVTSTSGGSEIAFTLNTSNVSQGTSFPYTITGISPSDVTSGSLTGSFSVSNNTASMTLGVSLEPTSPGVGSASLALDNGKASVSVFLPPTYSLSRSSSSVNEGSSITFTLTTTGIANGTSVPYTVSGISVSDLSSGSLTGNFVVTDGIATVTLTAASDSLTDGAETISITAGGQTSSATLNDTSTPSPTYTLSRSAASVNEGSSVTFTLTTTNVANGTSVPYSISGITSDDLSSGSLTGSFIINNGSAAVTLTPASDESTEGTETITITAASQTSIVTINDTSYAVIGPAETVLLLNGNGQNDQNNNVFLDSSSNNFAIARSGSVIQGSFSPFPLNGAAYNPSVHGGSAYFDGSSSRLRIASNPSLNILSGDFTIECFINVAQMPPSFSMITSQWQQSVGLAGYNLGVQHNGQLFFDFGAYSEGASLISTTTKSLTAGMYSHIAATRSGSNFTLFIDGQIVGSAIFAGARGDIGVDTTIGNYLNSSGNFPASFGTDLNAYISNARIVNGTALYTSNFTPSTAPLTNVENTSLLLNFTNGGVIDSTAKNTLTTVGDAKISTSIKKYGTGSMYFDGNSRVEMPVSNTFTYRTGPFTFEAWIYPTSIPIEAVIYAQAPYGNNYFMTSLTTSGNIRFWSNSVSQLFTSSASAPINEWTHIAVVREGTGTNQTKLYINGILDVIGTCAFDYVNQTNEGLNPVIGGYKHEPNYKFRGYIDDLRITKNLARYTSNFTPPTQQLTIDV